MPSLDPTYPLFPIVSITGFVISLVPIPWHLQAWNSGTCFFMFWTSLACLNHFVNSVVWADNFRDSAPWWCEISIRITLGASVGIPASSLCIMRRLHTIASIQRVGTDRSEKRRIVLIDSLICILYPIIYIALQYVVQGHRYDVFETIGCYPALYVTVLTYFISFSPPLATGLVSAIYCFLTLWKFNRNRLQFAALLKASPSLTASRYLRLMGLACSELICTTPICAFVVYVNSTYRLKPYISWDDTHYEYWRVEFGPYALLRSNPYMHIGMELTRWLAPFSAVVFFGFFGFAEEARKNYMLGFKFVKTVFTTSPPVNAKEKRRWPPSQPDFSGPSAYPLYVKDDLEGSISSITRSPPPYSPAATYHNGPPTWRHLSSSGRVQPSLVGSSSSTESSFTSPSTLASTNEDMVPFDVDITHRSRH